MLNEISNNIGDNKVPLEIDKEFQYIDKGFIDVLKFTTANGNSLVVNNINVNDLTSLIGNIEELTSNEIKVTELIFDEILGKLLFGKKLALRCDGFTLSVGEGFQYVDIRSISRPTWNNSQVALTSDISNPLKLIGVGPTEDRPTEDLNKGDYYLSTDEPALTVYVYDGKVWHQFQYWTLDMYRTAKDQDIIDAEIKQTIADNKQTSDTNEAQLKDQLDTLTTKEAEDVSDLKDDINDINTSINDIKAEQTIQNKAIQTNTNAIADKLTDAPVDDFTYSRKNNEWVAIDHMFDEKFVPQESSDEEENVGIISNKEGEISLNSSKSISVSTPGKDYPSNNNAPINVEYLHNNIKLTTTTNESDRVLRVVTANVGADPLSTAASVIPNTGNANTYAANVEGSDWYRRTKDFIYYKVDNVADQTASSFSFWMSIDRNGNVINMTDPGADLEQAVAGQSDFEKWITYHPSAWNGSTDNVAYFIRSGTNQSIEMYDNGKHIGHVIDGDGLYYGLLNVPVVQQANRAVGGKSLRRPTSPRCIVVNNSTTAGIDTTAGIIGVDKNGNEGLNRWKPFSLPTSIKYGPYGIAAGNNHWFAQEMTSNTWMAIDGNGEVKSYTLKDPVTDNVLGATINNVKNNFIELSNGDCLFYVYDATNKQGYWIYCNDSFTEDESPFVVYRAYDYSSSLFPLAENYPFVEHGDFIYFFPTIARQIADTIAYGTAETYRTYSRFNKATKEWVDFKTPWQNPAAESQTIAVKTYDKEEGKDYLWLFQSCNTPTASAPRQYLCVVIAENGEIQHIDIKNSTRTPWYQPDQDPVNPDITVPGTGEQVSADIPWFDNVAISGTTLLANYNFPMNGSGDQVFTRVQTSRPTLPYVAVTRKGIGIMVSNAARDVMVFYGNGKFYRCSYPNANSQGPWSNFTQERYLNIGMLSGIDGVKLVVKFNNDLISRTATTQNNSSAIIYIKVDPNNPLKEPQYFWKPYPVHTLNRRYFDRMDSSGYYITDFSDYKRVNFQDITPLSAGYDSTVSMTAYEIEAPLSDDVLYLKDGDYIISSTEI